MMLEDYSRALDDSIASIKLDELFTKARIRIYLSSFLMDPSIITRVT